MLLLLTIALVLVGAVALVIGFISGEQAPIFISIACSLLAGAVLFAFSRMSRRQAAPATAGGPAPLAASGDGAEAEAVEEEAEEVEAEAVSDEEVEETVAARERVPVGAGARPSGGSEWSAAEFPIEDYDELLVSEILPLLTELDADELQMVRDREQDGKARATLLRRIEQLQDEAGGGGGEPTIEAPRVQRERIGSVATPAAIEEEEEEEEDLVEDDDDLMFPIEDYDDLRVSEILPLLPELYDDELELVAERERSGANRSSILNRIEELLGGGAPAPAPKRAAPKKSAAKKTAAKKTAAKKTAAKKAAPKKAAAKKTAAKKSAAKKTAAKRR